MDTVMKECQKKHRYDKKFAKLPRDQGGKGRHKCAACAYEKGLEDGGNKSEFALLDLDTLLTSQAGVVRHKDPLAGYALGYLEGAGAKVSLE